MALDKLKGFFGMSEGAESMGSQEGDNAYYTAPRESTSEEGGTPGGSKMMLLEPRAYSESQQIADYLKQRNAVVVNLKRVTPEQAYCRFLEWYVICNRWRLTKIRRRYFLMYAK